MTRQLARALAVSTLGGIVSAPFLWAGALAPFADVTASAGIAAEHHELFYGIGQAWGDVDRDGCPDLYVTDIVGPNTLYRNRCDGTFEVSPHSPSVALAASLSAGAVFADYNGDGWLDLLVVGRGPNTLFQNRAGNGFSDVTVSTGLGDPGQGQSAAWADFDEDGDLDLFVVNYRETDKLYRNDGGSFTDLSHLLAQGAFRPGYATAWCDYDNDGDLDLYVVNDRLFGNWLYRNDGAGCGGWCFTDVSLATGTQRPVYGMGIAFGDYDGDLDLDFYFSSIAEMVLLENQTSQGSPTFVEVPGAGGASNMSAGWGTVFLDYDNDGWQDLYLVTSLPPPRVPNRLYRNQGDGTFLDVSDGSGLDNAGASLGAAIADYDRDGRVDVVMGNYGEGYRLYRNQMTDAGGSLALTFTGRGRVNRDALGTRAYVTTDDGRVQLQELKSGSSLGAGNEIALFFGLGAASVTQIRVVWPDGQEETLLGDPGPALHLLSPVLFADGFESGDALGWSTLTP